MNRRQLDVIEYLRAENQVLTVQLARRRLRLSHDQRRRLAAQGHRLGRRVLRDLATIVTPDTILRWHRQLIARKWIHERRRMGCPGILQEIEPLTVLMAHEHSRWGDTRIQGALRAGYMSMKPSSNSVPESEPRTIDPVECVKPQADT